MKTRIIFYKPIYVILASAFFLLNFSCKALFNADIKPPKLDFLEDSPTKNPGFQFPKNIFGASAGLGLDLNDSDNETAFCFGAEYQYRISNSEKGAGYLGAFANYHTESAGEYNLNTLKVGPKFTYFDPLTRYGEVDLTYGLKGHYETGSVENHSNKDDITGFGLSANIGVNFNVSDKFSIGVESPIVSYWDRTYKYDGGEINQSQTSIAINKNNPVMAYARWRF